jgi:hypothetical protein
MAILDNSTQAYISHMQTLELNNQRMAEALGVSYNTAKGYRKKCPDNISELTAWWVICKNRLEAIGMQVKPIPKRRGPGKRG